ELDEVLAGLEGAAPDARVALLRRAHELLPRLRPERWDDYRARAQPVEAALAALAQPAETLRAVGPRRAAELARFGLATVEDVLYHLPFRYEDRRTRTPLRALRAGEDVTAAGEVAAVRQGVTGRRGRRVLEVALRAGDGAAPLLVWFNQVPYFAGRFRAGQRLLVHGRVEPPLGAGPHRLVHPDVTVLADDGDLARLPPVVPVYEKPTAMPVGVMRRIVQGAVDSCGERVPAAVPPEVARRQRLIEPARALRHVHQPPAEADLEALSSARSLAHRSLIFDELFFLQLGLALRRSATGQEPGTAFPGLGRLGRALRDRLAFRLAPAPAPA